MLARRGMPATSEIIWFNRSGRSLDLRDMAFWMTLPAVRLLQPRRQCSQQNNGRRKTRPRSTKLTRASERTQRSLSCLKEIKFYRVACI